MNKITDKDLANRGVKGLPDVPGLTTEEMQRKLEEIAREILVPKVNEIIDNLIAVNSNLNSLIILSQEYSITTPSGTLGYYEPMLTAPVPDGYKLLGISELRSNNASVYFYNLGRIRSDNKIQIGYKGMSLDEFGGVIVFYKFTIKQVPVPTCDSTVIVPPRLDTSCFV